jgi:hypothetical protein
MFDRRTASEGVLLAVVVAAIVARARRVVLRTRMVECRARGVAEVSCQNINDTSAIAFSRVFLMPPGLRRFDFWMLQKDNCYCLFDELDVRKVL